MLTLCFIDSILNDAFRIVTGCLRPTPMDHLPVPSGIKPAELRRMGAILSLAYRGSLDPDLMFYCLLSGSLDARLRSRCPFVPAAPNLLDNLAGLGIRASEWTNHKCPLEWTCLEQPLENWCYAILFVYAQMGSRSFTKFRVRRRSTIPQTTFQQRALYIRHHMEHEI